MSENSYGCVLAYYDILNWNEISSKIKSEDIYNDEEDSFGVEDRPHVTVLYGLKPKVPDDYIRKTVQKVRPIPIKIMGTSIFENEDFDVLKFDVESSYLRKLNEAFQMFPHEKTHPNYKPHMTISYLKSGVGPKYSDFCKSISGEAFVSHKFVYSKVDGQKIKFNLKK